MFCKKKLSCKVLENSQDDIIDSVLLQPEGCNIVKTELHHCSLKFPKFLKTASLQNIVEQLSPAKQCKPPAKANKHGVGTRGLSLKNKDCEKSVHAHQYADFATDVKNHYKIVGPIGGNRNIKQKTLNFTLL